MSGPGAPAAASAVLRVHATGKRGDGMVVVLRASDEPDAYVWATVDCPPNITAIEKAEAGLLVLADRLGVVVRNRATFAHVEGRAARLKARQEAP